MSTSSAERAARESEKMQTPHLRAHHIDWAVAAHETPDPMAFYIALICKLEFHVDDETLLQIVADAQKFARSCGEPK